MTQPSPALGFTEGGLGTCGSPGLVHLEGMLKQAVFGPVPGLAAIVPAPLTATPRPELWPLY